MGPLEHKILREVAGELPPSPWGAAVGAALSWLAENDYISRAIGGCVTEKGKKYLEEHKP